MTDPRRNAAQAIYRAVLQAQRDAGAGDMALCQALDLLAENTGENRFRHAAAIVRGVRLGRHAIDDSEALCRIEAFPPDRRREAVGIVARQVAGAEASDHEIDAVAHRLRRKLRDNEADKLVLSATSVQYTEA